MVSSSVSVRFNLPDRITQHCLGLFKAIGAEGTFDPALVVWQLVSLGYFGECLEAIVSSRCLVVVIVVDTIAACLAWV